MECYGFSRLILNILVDVHVQLSGVDFARHCQLHDARTVGYCARVGFTVRLIVHKHLNRPKFLQGKIGGSRNARLDNNIIVT